MQMSKKDPEFWFWQNAHPTNAKLRITVRHLVLTLLRAFAEEKFGLSLPVDGKLFSPY